MKTVLDIIAMVISTTVIVAAALAIGSFILCMPGMVLWCCNEIRNGRDMVPPTMSVWQTYLTWVMWGVPPALVVALVCWSFGRTNKIGGAK